MFNERAYSHWALNPVFIVITSKLGFCNPAETSKSLVTEDNSQARVIIIDNIIS